MKTKTIDGICRIIISGLALTICSVVLCGQTPLSPEEKDDVVAAITESWEEWESVSISGKLKMDGLPLSPSVKIFMEKDSSIIVSLRAPLMGEVGRAEMTPDTLLVVNKMKKTYVKEALRSAFSGYTCSISDLQHILLGRVVIPGFGCLNEQSPDLVELYPEADGEYSLIPAEAAELENFNYGYLIDENARPEVLLVMPVAAEGVSVTLTYGYLSRGYDITVNYMSPSKSYTGMLELDSPDLNGSPVGLLNLNSRYTRLTLSQFMKSF